MGFHATAGDQKIHIQMIGLVGLTLMIPIFEDIPPVWEQAFHFLMLLLLTSSISVLTWCNWRLPCPRCQGATLYICWSTKDLELFVPNFHRWISLKWWALKTRTLFSLILSQQGDFAFLLNSVNFQWVGGGWVVHPSIFARPTNCIQEHILCHTKVPCDFLRCSSTNPCTDSQTFARCLGQKSLFMYIHQHQQFPGYKLYKWSISQIQPDSIPFKIVKLHFLLLLFISSCWSGWLELLEDGSPGIHVVV